MNLDEVNAVIIPGGGAPDRMRINKGLVKIVKEAHEKGKVIAAHATAQIVTLAPSSAKP